MAGFRSFINAHIWGAGRPGELNTMTIEGDRISGIDAQPSSGTERVDLDAGWMYPGFIDAHLHTLSFGLSLERVDLGGLATAEECVARVGQKAMELPAGTWIQGRGWNRNLWDNPAFPSRLDLDRAAPQHPVSLSSIDGHALWANTEALKRAGVDRATQDPEGGRVLKDDEMNPTGILVETAMAQVTRLAPPPSATECQRAIRNAMQAYSKEGITSVHDCNGMEMADDLEAVRVDGRLPVRFWRMLPVAWLDRAIGDGWHTGDGDAFARTGSVKVFTDGALGPNTAAMIEPYEGSDSTGVVVTGQDELDDIFHRATAAQLQVACHAIGDAAVRSVLDAIESTRKHGLSSFRPRIEHSQITHPDDIPRYQALDAIASMQPIHCTSDMVTADRLWGSRARHSYAWRSLQKAGAALVFGSDCPVEPCSVLAGLHAAVTRQRDGLPECGWYPEEAVDMGSALRAYTIGAAHAAGEEDEKGSLEVGKLADFVVLDRDLETAAPDEILEAKILLTVVGGDIVHDSR